MIRSIKLLLLWILVASVSISLKTQPQDLPLIMAILNIFTAILLLFLDYCGCLHSWLESGALQLMAASCFELALQAFDSLNQTTLAAVVLIQVTITGKRHYALSHFFLAYATLRILLSDFGLARLSFALLIQTVQHLIIWDHSQLTRYKFFENEKNGNQLEMIHDIFENMPHGALVLNERLEYVHSNCKLQKYLQETTPEAILSKLDLLLQTSRYFSVKDLSNQTYFLNLMNHSSWVKEFQENNQSNDPSQSLEEVIKKLAITLKDFDKRQSKECCILKVIRGDRYIYLRMKIYTIQQRTEQVESRLYLFLFENIKTMEEYILLADKSKFQEALLNSLCHELRTPINCALSSLMGIEPVIGEESKCKYLQPALVSTMRLEFLISDILDYGQIASNNLILNISRFAASQIQERLEYIFRQECLIKNIQFRFSIPTGLRIGTDQDRLFRVLVNLIDNALKFCAQGGTVQLSITGEKDQVKFEIQDDGRGMTIDMLDRINSESYIQSTYDRASYKLGLGIRLCKLIVKQLNPEGALLIESQLGQGTKVSFWLQHQPVNVANKKITAPSQAVRPACKCTQVLIVDDVAFNHHAMRVLLQGLHVESQSAYDGEQAVLMVQQKLESDCCKGYRVIFMDIEMPGQNGYITSMKVIESQYFQISHIYKQSGVKCLIVMCSAYTNESDVERARQSGMAKILPKPIKKDDLAKLINRYHLQL